MKEKMLHDVERLDTKDRFFVCGGNPEAGSGGGVIGTRDTLDGATALQRRAVQAGYRNVRVLTYDELMAEPEE